LGRILDSDMRPYRDELIISTMTGYDMWPGPYGEWGCSRATSKIATGTGDRSRRSNEGGRLSREEAKEQSRSSPVPSSVIGTRSPVRP